MENNLKKARKQAVKSQQQAANKLNTTQHQISKYENGVQDITLGKARILAEYYNVSLDYIAGRTEQPENPNLI
ncbi:MAG: helix-turn-helix transcriptional regulator [Oscillospiraceae bacterium]|nr:helix-turn-helix transcriptional regulator [Oscillospiraceae bacterium]